MILTLQPVNAIQPNQYKEQGTLGIRSYYHEKTAYKADNKVLSHIRQTPGTQIERPNLMSPGLVQVVL